MIEPSWNVMFTERSEPAILTSSPAVVEQLHLRTHALGRARRGASDR